MSGNQTRQLPWRSVLSICGYFNPNSIADLYPGWISGGLAAYGWHLGRGMEPGT